MGVSLGTLDRAQIERWRATLSDAIAANFAYPPFFDYSARTATMRPVDRAKRHEIDEFVRSANLESVERVDVSSPELRRYIERLFLRYLEVNPALAQPRLQRRLPQLRSHVPRAAADTQRALKGQADVGAAGTATTQRAQRSWSGSTMRMANAGGEHNTRVLEAVLARGRSGDLGLPSTPAGAPTAGERTVAASHFSSGRLAAVERARGLADAPAPTPAYGAPLPNQSPFAGLETGSQSTAFANLSSISEIATGPLVLDGTSSNGSAVRDGASGAYASASSPRELPPDLYRLYGEYLRDMQPEAPVAEQEPMMDAPTVAVPAAVPEPPYAYASPAMAPVSSAADTGDSAPVRPVSSAASAADARGDQLIFWQLRYQLEAYVRRASRSYGVMTQSGDPSGVLDALRRSGFVDESDLRIAEGILALTDRVTSHGSASVEDYRQALTLYLLYHRSHLGE